MSKQPVRRQSSTKDLRVARAVFNQPWAIDQPKLREIVAVVRRHMAGVQLSEEEIRAAIGTNEPPQPGRQGNGIVVIPVYGVIAYRMDMMTAVSGGTSLQRLKGLLVDAMGEPSLSTIVLRFETPGGSVDGMTEMAAVIRQLRGRGTKRIVASIDVRALSAGYWLASQCDEICCTPSGFAGAIGIVLEHCDDSEAMKMEGEITEVLSVPPKKADLIQPGPLSAARRARMLDVMTQFYGMFVRDVATGRGVTVARVESEYGGGDVLTATEAKAAGMIDRIETFDSTLARLGGARGAMISVRASAAVPTLGAAAAFETSHAKNAEATVEPLAITLADEAVEPVDGLCEDGYALRDDGLCHVIVDISDGPDANASAVAETDAAAVLIVLSERP